MIKKIFFTILPQPSRQTSMDIDEVEADLKRKSISRLNDSPVDSKAFIKADFFDPSNAQDLCNNEKFHHIL